MNVSPPDTLLPPQVLQLLRHAVESTVLGHLNDELTDTPLATALEIAEGVANDVRQWVCDHIVHTTSKEANDTPTQVET